MKQEALEVLKNRRSIRSFKKAQITDEELDIVLEAGTYAPNAMGAQCPVIVAVQDPQTVSKLDEMNAKVINMEQMPHPYYGAPAIILVLAPQDKQSVAIEDCSLAAGNMMNAAYAVGLGSCYIHRCKEMFESPEGKELLKEWGLPEDLMGVSSIAIGYPDGTNPTPAPRKADYILKV